MPTTLSPSAQPTTNPIGNPTTNPTVSPSGDPTHSPTVPDSIFIGPSAMSWDNAEAYCNEFGRHLIAIHSEKDQNESMELCASVSHSGSSGCWTGLRDTTNTNNWTWSDGSANDYGFNVTTGETSGAYPWHGVEPNNLNEGCIQLRYVQNYLWNDLSCNGANFPICKGAPTSAPTVDPTTAPSAPTSNPTTSPIPNDVQCGEIREGVYDGDWEYYLHVDNDTIVTINTCSSYLNPFSMWIYTVNGSNTTLFAECIECGSICWEPLKFRMDLNVTGTYMLTLREKHWFQMICESEQTAEPTPSPVTILPTGIPSAEPSASPTTKHPTASPARDIVVNVTFEGDGIPETSIPNDFLSDPFGRFEATITVIIDDESGVLGDIVNCESCFIWQYQSDEEGEWQSFQHQENDDIFVSITKNQMEYTTKLVVQSIRRLNAGNCVDDELKANHPFQEDTEYRIRLKFVSDSAEYYISEISNELNITTNALPSGGICIVQNLENLQPLEPYNLFCADWLNEENLEYNALIGDVAMSTAGFVDDARELTGVAPSGNVAIVVLVKEQNEYNAITCFDINATFKSMDDVISDLSSDNVTSDEVVDGILTTIGNITSTSSLSENPDFAVSIHSVVEDLFESNLTTVSEAEQIVDDMVVNILETSTVVASANDSTANITGNAIITELATVSSITSNEDIVDAESTTTQLVEEYLPNIFDAVDLFIDISADNASSNVSSTEVQDALYSIGEQSQELISNLEATLVDAVSTEDSSNITEEQIDSVNSLTESLVDFATLAASTALAQSEIGETFSFESIEYDDDGNVINSKVVNAVKFVADNSSDSAPKCGSTDQNMELPGSFMTDQEGTFDCAFMASTRNNFVPKGDRNQQRTTISDSTITVNIYGEGSGRRRRRLAEAVEYESNQCFPYLITIKLGNASFDYDIKLDQPAGFPSCDFWNTNASFWDTVGCFVYNVTDDSVICGCTHLTTFSASKDEIWPKPRLLTHLDWRKLNIENLIAHPTVWITCLCLFILIAVICLLNPLSSEKNTKSVIAYEDIIFKSTQDEKLWKDVSGKEIRYYSDFVAHHDLLGQGLLKQMETQEDRKSMLLLWWNLFKLYLRNDHTVLSLFQRTAGMYVLCTIPNILVYNVFIGCNF